jgi:hypothetical protein
MLNVPSFCMKVLLGLRTLLETILRSYDLLRSGLVTFRFGNEILPHHRTFDHTLDERSMLRPNIRPFCPNVRPTGKKSILSLVWIYGLFSSTCQVFSLIWRLKSVLKFTWWKHMKWVKIHTDTYYNIFYLFLFYVSNLNVYNSHEIHFLLLWTLFCENERWTIR